MSRTNDFYTERSVSLASVDLNLTRFAGLEGVGEIRKQTLMI